MTDFEKLIATEVYAKTLERRIEILIHQRDSAQKKYDTIKKTLGHLTNEKNNIISSNKKNEKLMNKYRALFFKHYIIPNFKAETPSKEKMDLILEIIIK